MTQSSKTRRLLLSERSRSMVYLLVSGLLLVAMCGTMFHRREISGTSSTVLYIRASLRSG